MGERKPSASLKHREYYDRAADAVPQFTVLNYGFSSDPENSVIAANEPEFYCLRLYEHTVRDTPLAGRDVLEVSCGRGGGASFVSRAFEPQRYLGVDLSEENIRLARARAARAGLTFAIGNAEQLDLAGRVVRRRHQHRGIAPLRRSRALLRRGAARATPRRLLLLHGRLLGRRRLQRGSARRRASSCSSASRSRATCCTRCARTARAAQRCSMR